MMKTQTRNTGIFATESLATAIFSLPVQIFNVLLVWQERATTRAGLRDLDARFLEDVGLSKHEAYIEARKPFWKK